MNSLPMSACNLQHIPQRNKIERVTKLFFVT